MWGEESESNEITKFNFVCKFSKHPRLPFKKQKNERSFLSISATTDDSPD